MVDDGTSETAMVDGSRRPQVTVVGLGPGGPDLVTAGTLALIERHEHRYLRTERHPAASVLAGAPTFDEIYETSDRIEQVYERIVEALVTAAHEHGPILYAVPGSPVVAERTVELLQSDERVVTVVHPALSFLDLAWASLGVDPVRLGVRIIDGHRFEVEAAGERGPLLVGQCDTIDVLSDIKLALSEVVASSNELRLTVVQRLGLPDEAVFAVAWDDLDRVVEPDHLTSVWIPEAAPPVAAEVQRFAELVTTLRRECPWDREQTHESLRRHLLEESYEVLDALDHVDPEAGTGYEHLEEELGDLLFQILFHATLAAEAGQFTMADVARTVHDKLYSRHPHVFSDARAEDADQVAANWEDLKKAEKGRASVFDGVPDALPALIYALKVQKKAGALAKGSTIGAGRAGVEGGDLDPLGVDAAVKAFVAAPAEGALGELLYAVVAAAREADVDPEMALRAAAHAHRDRWQALESAAD